MIIKRCTDLSRIGGSKLKLKCDIMTSVSAGPIEQAREFLTKEHIEDIFDSIKEEAIKRLITQRLK